jgi:spermidine synthase
MPQALHACFLALFLVSGAAGLVYQVVWARILNELFGVTAYAVATVLATFLGGLALGGLVLGRIADRRADPLRFYAWLELGVGLTGLVGTWTIRALDPLYLSVARRLAGDSAALVAVRVLLASVVILPPTFLMGGTLPAMTRVLVHRIERLGREVSLLYATNTLGAVLGTLAGGFVLIRWIGLHPTLWIAVASNVGVGAASFLLARRSGATGAGPAERVARVPAPAGASGFGLLAVMAVSGFAALGLEVLWPRVLVLVVGTTTYAFVTMLASFLVGIAGGSFVMRLVGERATDPRRAFGWIQLGIGATTLATLPLLRLISTGATEHWLETLGSDWLTLVGARFGVSFLVMLVPTTLMGMAFPLAARLWAGHEPSLAGRLGQVYGANTAGNIVGAGVTGFVLLPAFGIQKGIALLATLYLASAAWGLVSGPAEARGNRLRAAARTLPLAAALLGAAALLAVWRPRPFETEALKRAERLLFYREGIEALVTVYQDRQNLRRRSMLVDGVTIGTTYRGVDEKQQVLAHLPFLLLPDAPPASVLSIGLGTGVLLGEVARHESVRTIDCVEIESAVIEAAHLFAGFNHRVLDDPSVRVINDDGLNFLRRSQDRYEAIIADEKSRTGHAGNAAFFSVDYYQLCHDHLTPGGLMIQWVPLEVPSDEFQVILRSFRSVFPETYVWVAPPLSCFLVGSRARLTLDLPWIERALAEPSFAHLRRYGWRDGYGVASLLTADRDTLVRWVSPLGAVNTLERPVLEFYSLRAHATPIPARIADNLSGLLRARHEPLARLRLLGAAPAALAANDAAVRRLLEASALLERGGPAGEERAFALLAGALAAAPENGPLRYAAARAYLASGQADQARGALERAIVQFRRAIDSDPELAEAHGSLGSALLVRRDLDQAVAQYREALRLNPDDARIHYGLGVALAMQGDLAAAIDQLERALRIDPGYTDARDALARARAAHARGHGR